MVFFKIFLSPYKFELSQHIQGHHVIRTRRRKSRLLLWGTGCPSCRKHAVFVIAVLGWVPYPAAGGDKDARVVGVKPAGTFLDGTEVWAHTHLPGDRGGAAGEGHAARETVEGVADSVGEARMGVGRASVCRFSPWSSWARQGRGHLSLTVSPRRVCESPVTLGRCSRPAACHLPDARPPRAVSLRARFCLEAEAPSVHLGCCSGLGHPLCLVLPRCPSPRGWGQGWLCSLTPPH